MEEKQKTLKMYAGSTAIGLILALLMATSRGIFENGKTMEQIMVILSDACFVPGVILLGVGLLMWVAGEGMFDMIGFGVKLLWDVAYKHEWESYRDYKARKSEKPRMNVGFLVLVGLAFVAAGAVFALLYDKV